MSCLEQCKINNDSTIQYYKMKQIMLGKTLVWQEKGESDDDDTSLSPEIVSSDARLRRLRHIRV